MTRIQQLSEKYSVRSISWWRALGYVVDLVVCIVALMCMVLTIKDITVLTVVAIVVLTLYFALMETLYGKTIGKFVCKLSVVDANGEKPKFWQSLIRTVTRAFELNPKVLGPAPAFVCLLLAKKRQRIGDLLAKTYVVRDIDLLGAGVEPASDYRNV
jgi:uncharacterized RDD family membrane protein YckC